AELTLDARRVLDGVAEQLLAAPNVKIEIHGHTDNVGNPRSNMDLSERRARAVVGYLATKGIQMRRMKAVGFGQDVPVADNTTAEGRELNRRIEMIRVDD
ncbi:MAG: OmpA family protein, partial [Fibromonadaceae bacterium]|nr:OmpA family protein [Fibromonadaceae bacterium]